jgi:Flp pilus assembly protein TadB
MDNSNGRNSKRKAVEELSTNPNTIKARKRHETDDAVLKKFNKAKAADQGAVTYARKKARETSDFITASDTQKQQILDDVRDRVLLQRVMFPHAGNIVAVDSGSSVVVVIVVVVVVVIVIVIIVVIVVVVVVAVVDIIVVVIVVVWFQLKIKVAGQIGINSIIASCQEDDSRRFSILELFYGDIW